MKNKISNTSLSQIISKILKGHGISNICISPGSRNVPLIKSFTSDRFFNNYSHIDERSSGFFALGISKTTNIPAVILTTSGTAVANLLPAVIESDLSMTPLIILSADRPKKLINTGENQTITQNGIFNNFIRESIHIESQFNSHAIIVKKINNIIFSSNGTNNKKASGPVHINIAFDEPIIDKEDKFEITILKNKYYHKVKKITLPSFERPLIVCGQSNLSNNYEKIIKLSNQLNSPILADTVSQIRLWKKHKNIVCHYDFYIDNLNQNPDLILRFGKKPTSKKLNLLLRKYKNITYLITNNSGYNDDANNLIHEQDLIESHSNSHKWLKYIKEIDIKVATLLNNNMKTIFFEGNIIYSIINNLNNKDNLFVGNSLIVRNMEKYCSNTDKEINVLSNRGASGIDGIISTSLGMAAINKNLRNILIVGDVSFFYDISALLLNKNKVDLTIIVINNSGGQIFSTLNYQKKIKDFNKFMLTNTDIEIKDLCKLSNINYNNLKSINMINSKLNSIIDKKGLQIVEINTAIETLLNMERDLNKKIELII